MFFRKSTSEEKKRLTSLEKDLGYFFKKKETLQRAITHRSYVNEKRLSPDRHNERLEFLGDAVLELVISEFLMERHPDFTEGQLSKLRAAIVNEKQLATLARQLRLGEFLFLGKGEEQTSGREKNSLLADAFEALLGAVYLDGGFKKVTAVIRKQYHLLLDKGPLQEFYQDFKTELQERTQALFHSIPRYKLVAEIGPDHSKTFEIELYVRDRLMGKGLGRSKKEAEQVAAQQALEQLVNG